MKKRRTGMISTLTLVIVAVLISFYGNAAAAQAAKTAINKKNLTIKVGESKTLRVTNITKGQSKSVRWKSSNKQVATVNKKGKVTGRKAGTATITATVNKKRYSCKVTVVKEEKAEDDRTRLKKLIEQQTAKGANVPKSLSSPKYTWDENERLITIDWENKDVTGVIDFSSFAELKEISLGKNKQLTGFNTTGLSNLEFLECWRCDIEQIDVSSNINLTYLNVTGNKLTTLDVTHNTKLTGLACGYNQLTTLDVTHNAKLTGLICDDNPLTGLDFSQNRDLTNLSCSNIPLYSLDMSQQTQLTSLYCDNCQLTSLNVSSNPLLDFLYCPKNQLTSLDISQNLLLRCLYCSENALTSLDVSKNIKFQYLDCTQNQISTLDVSTLAQGGEGSTFCSVICDLSVTVIGAERPPVTSTVDANNNIIVDGNVLVVGQH